jgi:hypothetical protein
MCIQGWGWGGEMSQALYAHMNNKTMKKKWKTLCFDDFPSMFISWSTSIAVSEDCIRRKGSEKTKETMLKRRDGRYDVR